MKIQNLYRALDDYFPLHCLWHGNIVRLRDMKLLNPGINDDIFGKQSNGIHKEFNHSRSAETRQPGTVNFCKSTNYLRIKCSDDYVHFKTVEVKGKKPMSARDFFNGFISKYSMKDRYFT